MTFRVRAGLAAGSAGGTPPAAAAAGHAEAALFGRRGEVFPPGPGRLRLVLLRRLECHTDNVTHRPVKRSHTRPRSPARA
ncbi:hypothetical protein GCM10010260_79360 [Streptomyces filipinensis]|uniref:Uncharacterized protein n=1 Tax=Streptomyces filipinensis TaxID=66887 RepID=A0A918IJQ1_9ACTN|nr:hypothetical protein GCM10010260_79360 [Streptomyces filipinensis]